MNKKGFSLLEILLVFFAIVLIFFLSIPIVISIITKSRLNSYKISSANVIDALDYYLTQNGNTAISENGIDVTEIDESILKNNDFESGLIKLNKDDNMWVRQDVDFDYNLWVEKMRHCLDSRNLYIFNQLMLGYDQKEIGKALGCSHQAISQRVIKIKNILKEKGLI